MTLDYAYLFNGDLYQKLLKSIPEGKYFDNRGTIIPKEDVSEFRVSIDYVNEVHYVAVICENGSSQNFTFVPSSNQHVLRISLPKGLNTITVYYNKETNCTKSFSCTYFGTLMYSVAKELNRATTRLDRLYRDIYKQESTRISSPVQHYSKQLPDKTSVRIFGIQLITRALVNSPGTFESLEDICKAIYVSTPKIENIESKDIFDLSYYSFAGQEYELGKIVYLWVRDSSLVRKLYGSILARNFGIPIDTTDTTLESSDGFNEYESYDNPIEVDESGFCEFDYYENNCDDDSNSADTDNIIGNKPDGFVEINISLEINLPRLDRNLPIPFTKNHPWHDADSYKNREHLDEGLSLDIATWKDPFNKGLLGKQYIPYRYDGSKVTSLIEVIKLSHLASGFAVMNGAVEIHPIIEEDLLLMEDSQLGECKIELINDENTNYASYEQ